MRIDETSGAGAAGHPNPLQRKPADPPRTPGKPEPLAEGPEAEVQLSERARDLQHAKRVASATPEVREERLAELRQQLESGAYRVDTRELARKILEELRGR